MTGSDAPKRRDTSGKQQAIIDGAVQVFTDVGYDKASMDMIAEVAGVSKRTVYNHFLSKENLFQEVIAWYLGEQQELKQITYDPERSLVEQLEEFANAELFLVNSPTRHGLSRVLTSVLMRDIEYARLTRAKYAPPHEPLTRWLVAACEDKRLNVDNPALAARVFYAMIEGAFTWPALFQPRVDAKKIKPLMDELLVTFMARYAPK